MTTFTASEVREHAELMRTSIHNLDPITPSMLHAFAERLEADEKAVPVAEWEKSHYGDYPVVIWRKDYRAKVGDKLYIHPAPADAERLAEALRPFAKLLQKHHDKQPDDHPVFAINGEAFTFGDLRNAKQALAAQAQPPAASVPDGFLRHVAAVCRGAVENCRPKASLIPEDPQEHNGGLCLNELTHIAGEIARMLAAQENPNG